MGSPCPTPFGTSICVEQHQAASRNLAQEIAEALRAEGVHATSAGPKLCPADAPYKVTYLDNWSWDLRMFLAKLTVEVVDTSTGEIVAYGESTRSPPSRSARAGSRLV